MRSLEDIFGITTGTTSTASEPVKTGTKSLVDIFGFTPSVKAEPEVDVEPTMQQPTTTGTTTGTTTTEPPIERPTIAPLSADKFGLKPQSATTDATATITDPLLKEKYKAVVEKENPVESVLKQAGGSAIYADDAIMQARREVHPVAATVGEVGETVVSTVAGGVGALKLAMKVPKLAQIAKASKIGKSVVSGLALASSQAMDYTAKNNELLASSDPEVAEEAKKNLAINVASSLAGSTLATYIKPTLVQAAAQAVADVAIETAGQAATGDNAFDKEHRLNTIISGAASGIFGLIDIKGVDAATGKAATYLKKIGQNKLPNEIRATPEQIKAAEEMASQIEGVTFKKDYPGFEKGDVKQEPLLMFNDEVTGTTKTIKAGEGVDVLKAKIDEARRGSILESGKIIGRTLEQVDSDAADVKNIVSDIEQRQASEINKMAHPTNRKKRVTDLEEGMATPSEEELFIKSVKDKYGDTKPTKAQVVSDFKVNREKAGWAIKNAYIEPEPGKAVIQSEPEVQGKTETKIADVPREQTVSEAQPKVVAPPTKNEYVSEMYQRGKRYGESPAQDYIPDFKNAKEKSDFEAGARASMERLGVIKPTESPATPSEKIAGMKPEPSPLTMGGLAAGQELPKNAVNINLERINADYDAKRAILETSADYSGKIDEARRGVITHEATRELAENLGMTETKLLKRRKGQAFNAEEALAARDLLNTSANRIVKVKNDIMQKRKEGTLTDNDLIDFRLEMSKHAAIQAEVSGLTAEAGRALSSFRILSENKGMVDSAKDLLEKLGGEKNVNNIIEKLDSFDDDDIWSISRFIGKVTTETIPEKINRYFIESILSGLPTHVANGLSNTVSNLYRMGLEKPFEIAAEKVIKGKESTRSFSEIPAEFVGMKRGFSSALSAAKHTLFTGEQKISGPIDTEPNRSKTKLAALLPTRWLAAADEFFKTLIVSGDLHSQAYSTAKNDGLKGEDLIKRMGELIATPSKDMLKHAWKEAEYRTFTGKPGNLTSKLSAVRSAIPLRAAHYVVPFLNTPMKILKYGLERTPITAEARLLYKGLRGEISKEQIPEEIGKIAFSHAAAIPLILAARNGDITGAGPQERNERNALYSTGWQPYSIKIGDKYYSYARMEPIATILGFIADFSSLPYSDIGEKGMVDMANRIGYAIGQNILNKTFFEQLSNVVKATEDPGRYGIKFINRFAGSIIPNIVGKAADVGDKNLRQGNEILEIWQKKIPGASNLLFPKRDVWGRPIEKKPSGIYAFFSPIRVSKISQDLVDKEVARLELKIGEPSKKVGKNEMPDQLYDQYSSIAGELALKSVNRFINTDWYKKLTDEEKKKEIKDVITKSRKKVRKHLNITGEED